MTEPFDNKVEAPAVQEPRVNPDWSAVLRDIYSTTDKSGNPPEKRAEKVPLDEETVEKYATRIADIISRASDFSYGGKNQQIQTMVGDALTSGESTLKQLVDSVNKHLGPDSNVTLSAKYTSGQEERLEKLGGVALMTNPSRYPDSTFSRTKFAVADLSLTRKNGELEDSLTVRKDLSRETYRAMYIPPRHNEQIIMPDIYQTPERSKKRP